MFAATMLLTYLFVSAIAALVGGTSAETVARSSAESVLAVTADSGETVSIGEERRMILVVTGSLAATATAAGKLVDVSDGDSDRAVVVAELDGGGAQLQTDVANRAAAFARVASTEDGRIRLAAEDFGAELTARDIRAIVLPAGFAAEPAAWRCAFTSGLVRGGVAPVFHASEAIPLSALGGCAKAFRGGALYGKTLGRTADNSAEPLIFVGRESLSARALSVGAMAVVVDQDALERQIDALAAKSLGSRKFATSLEGAATKLDAWMRSLPVKGERPSRTPPPKPQKSQSGRVNPSIEDPGTSPQKKSSGGGGGAPAPGPPSTPPPQGPAEGDEYQRPPP